MPDINIEDGDLQPRAQRRRKRNAADRGLPSDIELTKLAEAYLKIQHQLWPEFVKLGLLSPITDNSIHQMVIEYKERHQTGCINAEAMQLKYLVIQKMLAAAYARYSCDNSSPTSILDQVVNMLVKAKEHGRFIPWEFVFADYSVSGLDSGRLGYLNCKALIDHAKRVIESVYIDDFTRASRDSLEWWKLGAFCKRRSMRMIGASDGFDLSSDDWEMKITVYGLLSRLFIRSLQEKVGRGMRGAAQRRTCLGKPPMGFTRKVVRDAEGNPIVRPNGKPLFTWAIDPTSREFVERLFELFVDQRLSAYEISKRFNRQKCDKTDTWSESTVKNMLSNPAYIGVFIWNRTHREFDYDTEKWVTVPNPQEEWIFDFDGDKAIISMDKWWAARELLAQTKRKTGLRQPVSRNQQRATTLFSGTMFCGYCGRELMLYRSAGKYKSVFCMNGRQSVHSCQLCTSKSTRVIEDCLLTFIKESVLTDASVDELVAKANVHLETLAGKPKTNVAPIRSKIASLQKKIDPLVRRVEDLTEPESGLRESYERRIIQLQKEIDELKTELRTVERANAPVPPKLSKKALRAYLPELRAILNQEIPQAAEALRQLTGPISIRQEPIAGKKHGARWIASFSPDLLALLRQVALEKDYPDSITLEFLSHGIWIVPSEVSVVIEEVPKYERLATGFREMHEKGTSVQTIAAAHGMCWDQVKMILHFAQTGERPKWPSKKKSTQGNGGNKEKYLTYCNEVTERRARGESFASIARELGVSEHTVRRAWDHTHRESILQAAQSSATPARGNYRHIDADKLEMAQSLLRKGKRTIREIATQTGVSESTVRREKHRMANQ